VAKIERLSGWDFATWRSASEDPILRSTMVGAMVLHSSPDWQRLVDRYDRASRTVPILRQKIIEGPVGIANPRLVTDAHFDLSFHLRRFLLPEGSTWQDVLDECRRQSMTDFDSHRPLWKVTLLEGLPGGKAVLISKLHHAIADGQGALALGAALVDISPEGFDLGDMPAEPEGTDLSPLDFAEIMVTDNTEWVVRTSRKIIGGALPAMVNALTDPQHALDRVATTAASLARFVNTPTSPLSPLMTKRSINYHFDSFSLPFEELKGSAKKHGHTVNDAFLAAISLGMGEYHKALGEPVDELHINMPISTRQAGKEAQNAVTIARFNLPTNLSDVEELMTELGQTVRRMRAEPAMEFTNHLGEISRFIPKELLTTAAQASDVTASNVPGPPIPIYLAGALVDAIIPLPPPIGAAVFVALMTYNGNAAIGVATDDAAITDRELLMSCLRGGFETMIGKKITDVDPLTDGFQSTRKPAKKAPAKKKKSS